MTHREPLRERLHAAAAGVLTDDRRVFARHPDYALYLAILLREAADANRETRDVEGATELEV